MNIYTLIPLLSVVIYLILIAVVLTRPLAKVHKVFALFLSTSVLWSFCSFILHANYFSTQSMLWNRLLIVTALLTMVTYYHFIRTFFNKPAGIIAYLGYISVVGFTIFVFLGGMLKSSYVISGAIYNEIDESQYLLSAIGGGLIITSVFYLLQGLSKSRDALERNKIGYMLLAVSVWMIFALTNFIPTLQHYSFDHMGNIAMALIISYAAFKYQLLDLRLLTRKTLAYFLVTVFMLGIFTGIILIGNKIFDNQPIFVIILYSTGLAILLTILARPLIIFTQKWVDRFFYRESYDYRQMLVSFYSKMSNIIDLDELANEMLPTISKALRTTYTSILLEDVSIGNFVTKYSHLDNSEFKSIDELSITNSSSIVAWLEKENNPLEISRIDSIPQLKGLWQEEREKIINANLSFLCPIKSRDKLIGILSIGAKKTGTIYLQEDIELVMSMAKQAGTIIENAQLYSQALVRANTDGLTGLYNHRHFHERLEQEIARGSRFGTTFSLIMLDIDLFKAYNDIQGHLAGDEALRKVGRCIESSIRSIDLAFRYGGEEFAVILPETQLSDAHRVAERIRKTIESQTSPGVIPITISIGVSNWPIDGVMREEIIAQADAALYQAKQTGRNRTCLSSEIARGKDLIGKELEVKPRALSIIYALAATVDAKDHYTYGHSKKVSDYSVALAEAIDLPEDRVSTVRAAGLLHDIGKVAIPDSILSKKGPLTDEEWEPVKAHPKIGAEILRHIIDLANCLPAILHHHEYYDGNGYPSGLRGDNIPVEARILSTADAYEAMTSARPYRDQLSPKQALDELVRCSGSQFDPKLVDAFCKIIESAQFKKLETK